MRWLEIAALRAESLAGGARPQPHPQNRLAAVLNETRGVPDEDWPHGRGGTCVPECPLFTRCHCGCGRKTVVAQNTQTRDRAMKGRPWIWRGGHNRKVFSHSVGAWRKHGIPIKRVRPLAHWLRLRHGGFKKAARFAAMSDRTFNDVAWSRDKKRVTPEIARQIVDAVRRTPHRSFDRYTWEELDVPPRLATEEDAELSAAGNRATSMLERQYNIRAGKTEREERAARVRREQRERLSIKELVG